MSSATSFARERFFAMRARTNSVAELQRRAGLPVRPVAKAAKAMAPEPSETDAIRLSRGRQLGRLTQVIEHGRRHVQAITASQLDAARHLDSAEVALDRLLAEIRLVMPVAPRTVYRQQA